MILVCPTCRTRYKVDDEAVSRPSGRTVRCANCGNSWHHLAPPPAPLARLSERRRPAAPPAPPRAPRPAITAPTPPRRRRSGLGWVFVILLLGGAIISAITRAIVARDKIVAIWPQTAQFYDMVGYSAEPLGAGLDIANITSTRNADGLIVEGDITNRTNAPRPVPHLRV